MSNALAGCSFLVALSSAQRNQLSTISDASRHYLNRIVAIFPTYTDHSLEHPDRALRILDAWLLDAEQRAYLNAKPWTAFFIVCGIYLHDIGMADLPGLPEPPATEEKASWIRDTHHERSSAFIKTNWKELGFSDEFQAEIAALVCLAHRKTEFNDPRIARRIPYGHAGELVDIRFAAASVKLADELDLTFERTPYQVREMLTSLDSVGEVEWSKHLSVGGVGPHDELPATIRVWCLSKSAETHRALKRHEAKLQGILDEINRFVTPRFKFFRLQYEIEKMGYEAEDLRFEMSFAAGLRVLTSLDLYGDRRVFLRELIQNSIDACLLRAEVEPELQPQIIVRVSPSLDYVIVEDNGIGMDLDAVRKYLVPVGVSFYQSSDYLAFKGGRAFGFSPISSFGVGLLSCFMVAERIVISSQNGQGDGFALTIVDPLGYFEIEKTKRSSQGTEVRVIFARKPNSLVRYVINTVHCSRVPISWIDKSGERDDIRPRSVSVREELRVERWWHRDWKRIFEVPIDFEESDGFVYCWLESAESASLSSSETTKLVVLQDGLVISDEPELVPEWGRKFLNGRVNLRGAERVGLTLSRNAVVRDPRFDHLGARIEQAGVKLLDRLLSLQLGMPEGLREAVMESTFAALQRPLSSGSLMQILLRYMFFDVVFSSGKKAHVRLPDLGKYGISELVILKMSEVLRPVEYIQKKRGVRPRRVHFSRGFAADETEEMKIFDFVKEDKAVIVGRRYQAYVLEAALAKDGFLSLAGDRYSLRYVHVDPSSDLVMEGWDAIAPWERSKSGSKSALSE